MYFSCLGIGSDEKAEGVEMQLGINRNPQILSQAVINKG
jgi:hypothetical protein